MNYNYDFMTNLQQLYQYLEAQQRKIEQLENSMKDLQNELATLNQQISRRPEKIEYKFDQLKVERLEGTLNIGITPTGGIEPNSFEDFAINQNKINVPNPSLQNSQFYESIKKEVDNYLNGECYNVMKSIEQLYNYQLDTPYREFIVEDIRKQIDSRIQYYIKDINIEDQNEEALDKIKETTLNTIKNDINRTVEEFVKHIPRKGE
ncbi:spore germination protein GerPC [Bacillaceae bacterium IKA-2]|nr:spore germination protein GerPC [Bacillaceae bacterium IKA-2]